MLRKTYSILAVALTASACGGATESSTQHQETKQELADELSKTTLEDALKRRDHFAPLCDGDGYPLPGNVNPKQSGTTVAEFCDAIGKGETKPGADPPPPSTGAPPPPPPPPPPTCDLDTLSHELQDGTPLDQAVANYKHFRCLCDDKGYPLVGNINSKGTKASEFCATLKEKGLL